MDGEELTDTADDEGGTGAAARIVEVRGPAGVALAREMIAEWCRWLEVERGVDLGYQAVRAELDALPGAYAPPSGGLWLAFAPAPCAAALAADAAVAACEGAACERADCKGAACEGAACEGAGRASAPAGPEPQPAGCVALRALGDGVCELKRLYVRPAFRGHGLGRALTVRAVTTARAIGYRAMRLDTAEFLPAANRLYAELGFRGIAPYYPVPPAMLPLTIFLELAL